MQGLRKTQKYINVGDTFNVKAISSTADISTEFVKLIPSTPFYSNQTKRNVNYPLAITQCMRFEMTDDRSGSTTLKTC